MRVPEISLVSGLQAQKVTDLYRCYKYSLGLEDLRIMSLQSLKNLNLFAMLVARYIAIISAEKEDAVLCWN